MDAFATAITQIIDISELMDREKEIKMQLEQYEEDFIRLLNATKEFEDHWYIPVPFTKKRLIFSGLKYIGWYTYK